MAQSELVLVAKRSAVAHITLNLSVACIMKPVLPVLLPVGALLVAIISIQAGASFAKSLFPVLGADGTNAMRLILGALMLTLVLRPWRARIDARNWRMVTLYGIIVASMNLAFYLSIERIPLGIAASIQFVGPLSVAILSSRRRLDFLWVAFATAGLLLLLPIEADIPALDPLGVFYALAAGLGWALYIIVGKRAGAEHGAYTPALGMIVAAIVILPFGGIEAGALLSRDILPLVFLVAALSSALPFALEMMALRRLTALTYGTLTSLEPAIGALSGLIILQEMLSPLQWLAVALVICASIGTTLTMPAAASRPAE